MVDTCIEVLQRSDVQSELKHAAAPIADRIIEHMYPYVLLVLAFAAGLFVLHLSMFFMLYRMPRPQQVLERAF